MNKQESLEKAIELLETNTYKNNYTEEALKLLRVVNAQENVPNKVKPVLAEITKIGDLNKHTWYEIVYYDGNDKWRTYQFGSVTFDSSEYEVLKWKYCDDILGE